jgi:hypothetical protein
MAGWEWLPWVLVVGLVGSNVMAFIAMRAWRQAAEKWRQVAEERIPR